MCEKSVRFYAEKSVLTSHCLFLVLTDHQVHREKMSNSSSSIQFLLLAFADTWGLQLLHF